MSTGATWASTAERGSIGALRAMAWLYRRFGRSLSIPLLTPIAAYFLLRDGKSRRASLQYLRRLHAWPEGRPAFEREPGLLESLRHFREFAINIFDRICVWTGEADRIEIRDEGSEHLFRLAQERRGAILLGAHLGSFDMLRVLSERQKFKVNVLMFSRHVAQITSFFERLHPEGRLRVIQMDPGSIRSVFEVKACIDRGEFVGILGDRDRTGRARSGRHRELPRAPCALPARPVPPGGAARLPRPPLALPAHGRRALRDRGEAA